MKGGLYPHLCPSLFAPRAIRVCSDIPLTPNNHPPTTPPPEQ